MNYQNPFQGSIKPPDMDKVKKAGRRFTPVIVGLLILLVLGFNCVYTLNNGEEAVITRFGKHIKTEVTSGLKFKLPFADTAHIVNVAGIRRMEFGFREYDVPASAAETLAEALMLTGEISRVNGLVNADWVIQYRISDSYNYTFKVQSPEDTLRSVTQAAYRRIAAAYPLDAILTDRKDDIQLEVRRDLQGICDKYEMGVEITSVNLQDASPPDEVREAFLDVTRALEDKEAKTNEAERYRNEEEPRARGRAAAAINEAEAYKEKRVNEAHGAVARYKAIEEEYRNQPDIMRTRLYLEMIREVMPKIEKVYFLDQTSGGLLEILHLGQ
ncbi:MAG: FtsH protease activity modulator HflK [Oscillospiraceae bacterium]|jgi:membrane protease subunit HflK|nr:FtsH protease activity modulator HflK [Oscillospiraceae bacterium]